MGGNDGKKTEKLDLAVSPNSPNNAGQTCPLVVGTTLGTGSFGRVKICQKYDESMHTEKCPHGGWVKLNPKIEAVFALKMLKKANIIRLKQVDHIVSEKTILCQISSPGTDGEPTCPFIVKLHLHGQDNFYLYLLLEYVVGGEFFTHLRKRGRFENDDAKFYAGQITIVFHFLHNKNIIYRDLKPENILLAQDGYLKLTDFGFAKAIEYRTYTLCGTPEYIAPEVLLNKGHGKPVDWWTLGILIYEMVVGYPPFVDEDPMGIYQKILSGKIVFPKFFDKNAKTLVKKLLTADLGKRFGNLKNGVDDIKRSKWFMTKGATDTFWQDVESKKYAVTYKPVVKHRCDTENFDIYPDSCDATAVATSTDPFLNSW